MFSPFFPLFFSIYFYCKISNCPFISKCLSPTLCMFPFICCCLYFQGWYGGFPDLDRWGSTRTWDSSPWLTSPDSGCNIWSQGREGELMHHRGHTHIRWSKILKFRDIFCFMWLCNKNCSSKFMTVYRFEKSMYKKWAI